MKPRKMMENFDALLKIYRKIEIASVNTLL